MKNFKNILIPSTLCLLMATFILTSCEQDEPFLDQIAKPTGLGYYPVIGSASVDPGTSLSAGSDFSVDLRYWSLGAIESIKMLEVMDDDSTEVFSSDYQPAYSTVSRTDSLLINYTIPIGKPEGTAYVVKVVNENTLSREQQVVTVE